MNPGVLGFSLGEVRAGPSKEVIRRLINTLKRVLIGVMMFISL